MPTPPRPTEIARDVLRIERDAPDTLQKALPPDFDAVVDLLLTVPGRVIVSGMGKSGHVAAKIAATMASTGTPASNASAITRAEASSHSDGTRSKAASS